MDYKLNLKTQKKIDKYARRDTTLYTKVLKQLRLFRENEKHPSLRTHKLKGELNDYWSISVDMNYRLVGYISGGTMYFIDIGTHDEVYEGD